MANLVLKSLQNLPLIKRSSADNSLATELGSSIFSLFNGITRSGVVVDDQSALTLAAVFNAVDQISNDIAKLPKGVFYRDESENRNRDRSHPVDYLISKRSNPATTQFNFHKSMMIWALLKGNAVAVILRNEETGFQTGFDLVKPEDLQNIYKKAGILYYKIKGYPVLSSEDVIHIPGFSFNGITGVSVFKYAAQNMGAALSAETFADENFKSKGLLAGIIKSDKVGMSGNAKANIANAMESRLSKGGSHNIGFLDEGMDFKEITTSAAEASLIDWKKISIEDVARWFNIAPHKIKHLENATYSNIEQQSLEHGSDCIAPWVKRFEEEYDAKLFREDERMNYYVRFNTNALIRTDIKTKSESYSRDLMAGWRTRNEVRALEDLNAIDGLDEPLVPANAFPIDENNSNNEQ